MPPNAGSIGRSSPLASAGGDGESLVRVVELSPGQRIQATVVDTQPGGAVMLGLLGGRVAAFSKLALEIGKTYEFTVASVSPRIVLSAAKDVVLPDVAGAAATGKLGAPQADLVQLIEGVVRAIRAGTPASAGASPQFDEAVVRGALTALASGKATADDLRAIHQTLGHDQEVRVLRHAARSMPIPVEVAALRQTVKAEALAYLSRAEEVNASVRDVSAARELVDGLTGAERDNARRAEHGAATWLPLPTPADGEVRDARMFLLHSDEREGSQRERGPEKFTIVLLLDMSRLGAMRVDITVAGKQVDVLFEAADADTASALFAAAERLQRRLEEDGLDVAGVRVRQAPGRQLSIADLLSPPGHGANEGLLDVHA